jgi:anaerobic selenocysteine-containing dehydrogenase
MPLRKSQPPKKPEASYNAPLRVAHFHATRMGDADRGPEIRMRGEDAVRRLLTDGELVYVSGPRRKELARLVVDDRLPRGDVALRDIAGVAPSEIIRVHKPEFDRGPRGHFG